MHDNRLSGHTYVGYSSSTIFPKGLNGDNLTLEILDVGSLKFNVKRGTLNTSTVFSLLFEGNVKKVFFFFELHLPNLLYHF
jgi:hypothetical protein